MNLIVDSLSHTITGTDDNTFWSAADELEPGQAYTLSVQECILAEGDASGATWQVVNRDTGEIHTAGLLDFTYGKQVVRFTVPDQEADWGLYLFAGEAGSTYSRKVTFNKAKLEEGGIPSTWSAAPDETTGKLGQLTETVTTLDAGINERVNDLIAAMGLSDQFASAEEFLNAVSEIELIRSELEQFDNSLNLTFSRLVNAEDGLAQIFSSFVFGEEDGAPYLDMSTSQSSVKMRLTNTRLAFMQSGQELAYFSDNKLFVTRLEAVNQISIGTDSNGFLDIVTTPSGVGFKWRS